MQSNTKITHGSKAGQRRRDRCESNTPSATLPSKHGRTKTTSTAFNHKKPAANAAGSTYELNEAIAINLPAQQLFTMQRVNSNFRGVIQRSEKLQQRMGPMPTPNSTRLPTVFPTQKIPDFGGMTPNTTVSSDALPIKISFERRIPAHHRHFGHLSKCRQRLLVDFDVNFSSSTTSLGSWKDLQPPKTTSMVILRVEDSQWINRGTHRKNIETKDGLTLGDIYQVHRDFIKELDREYGVCVTSDQIEGWFRLERRIKTCCKVHCCKSGLVVGLLEDEDGCNCCWWISGEE